ncbi:carboxypeptidase M32 [Candidatus Oscillochloris fontis]|uniref:carboxypeptidase M32 n=1 Tax=Candidatus Oscillochloris fontis TaxID=2496868 RepID=UPI00101C65C4|nr:carboxypeptidase M32 [Candidatus Oscillochloris fontis]
MEQQLEELKRRLGEVFDLQMVGALLGWDQSTYMPAGGAEARGRQMATIGRIAHQKATDEEIGALLEDLQPYAESLDADADDAALIRVARRTYEQQVRIPEDLIGEMLAHSAASYDAWTRARPANDFAAVRPLLERTLDLSRRIANCFPGYQHIADPLIDMSDYGMRAETVRAIFTQLRAELVPLVQAITAQAPANDVCLHRHYPAAQQKAFGEQIIRAFGYDFERGRQDLTHHPFMTKFSLGDVRITTRYNEHDLSDGLFSTLHESGHAMYEQGIKRTFEGTPLANGTSAGVHESQSRLWENLVGRSRSMWEFYYPQLQAAFPAQLADTPLDTFYRAINKVQRSLIRTDSDEVTYNLHVMIRFDLELALLEGSLEVKDLPEAWNTRYREDLGITPPNDSNGVLQDVHWFSGPIGGAFQGYTLGNIMSAQFFAAACAAQPTIESEISQGEFGTLHGWLQRQIYTHGSKFTTDELLQRTTGGPLDIGPYMAYLRKKYGAMYQIG